MPWTLSIVSGVSDGEGETVVWGTSDGEGDTVVWGTSDTEAETVVWGTSCSDPSCQPVVWNRQFGSFNRFVPVAATHWTPCIVNVTI